MRNLIYGVLLLLSLLFHQIVNAQNRSGDVWCFDNGNQIDFINGIPTIAANCSLTTWSGSASIADSATGQLLFYTDGVSVWDNTNTQMPGNTTSLGAPSTFGGTPMPTLIVPVPGANKKYYILTTGSGVSYSEIDMTLRGGLGDVSQQPQVLLSDNCARITGTYKANGAGAWVLVHLLYSKAFYAYPVTSTGIGSPVISNQGDVDSSAAIMKISPKGSMVAAIYNSTDVSSSRVEVFGFNNSTGVVSPPVFIDSVYPDTSPNEGPYGLTFSPNSRLLYVGMAFDSLVYQYNLYAGNASAVLASKYSIGATYSSGSGASPVALQISSNQKIYVGIFDSYVMDAINFPNVYGLGCGYIKAAVTLNINGMEGLPNFIDHIFVPDSVIPLQEYTSGSSTGCMGSCSGIASVVAYDGYPPYTYLWQPGNLTGDTIFNVCPGKYYVRVMDSIGHVANDSVLIAVLDTPQVTITGDTVACPYTQLCATSGYNTYSWDSGQTSVCVYGTMGNYSVTVTDYNGCSGRSPTFSVVIHTSPIVTGTVIGDTLVALCNDSVTYRWFTSGQIIPGETNYFYDSLQAGFYSVLVTDTDGCSVTLYFSFTSISQVLNDTIRIYPNPSLSSAWQLSVDESLVGSLLEVYDDNGKCVYKSKISGTNSSLIMNVAKGVYFLHIHTSAGDVIRKLMRD